MISWKICRKNCVEGNKFSLGIMQPVDPEKSTETSDLLLWMHRDPQPGECEEGWDLQRSLRVATSNLSTAFKASYREVEIGSMSSIRVFLLVEHLIWCKSKCLVTLMVFYEINKPSPIWPIYRFSFLRLDPSFPEEALTILWGFLRQRWIDCIIFSWGVYKD